MMMHKVKPCEASVVINKQNIISISSFGYKWCWTPYIRMNLVQREQQTETHSKDKAAVDAYRAYNQNRLYQKEEKQLLRHHDWQGTTYENTSGQGDDATYGEIKQQHDSDEPL